MKEKLIYLRDAIAIVLVVFFLAFVINNYFVEKQKNKERLHYFFSGHWDDYVPSEDYGFTIYPENLGSYVIHSNTFDDTEDGLFIVPKFDKEIYRRENMSDDSVREKDVFPKGVNIDVEHLAYIHYRCNGRENVRVYSPKTLFVADDGHRVTDTDGSEHFIPNDKFFHVKSQHKGERRQRDVLVED